jgi:hypothetical protein
VSHRIPLALCCALLLALPACQKPEEENVQLRAENASRALEQRYQEIEAEAENRTNAAVAPLDNEADALLGQMANGADANAAVNAAE